MYYTVDVSLMLREISSFRQEVRATAELRAKTDNIKSTLQSLVDRCDVNVLQDELARRNSNYNVEYPSLHSNGYPNSQNILSNVEEVPYATQCRLPEGLRYEGTTEPTETTGPGPGRPMEQSCIA